jgi:hypothetical protein
LADPNPALLLGLVPYPYQIYFLLAIIISIYAFRLIRGALGEKFSESRLFFGPVLYCVLVAISFVGATQSEMYIAFIDSLLGIWLGIVFSGNVKVFRKSGVLYYRRSLVVITLWTTFFSIKLIQLLYGLGSFFDLIPSILLTVLTGMIVGEALRIFYKYRKFQSGKSLDFTS